MSTLRSLELSPDNPAALINLSSIYKKLGNLDAAIDSSHKALNLKPDSIDALGNLIAWQKPDDSLFLRRLATRSCNETSSNLFDLDFVEAVSSLGEDFLRDLLE